MSKATGSQKLAVRLLDPGFTPGSRQFPELFELLSADDELAERSLRALARAGLPAARAALGRLRTMPPPARWRLLDLIGRVARVSAEPDLLEAIAQALKDPDPKTRRYAIRSAGTLPVPNAEKQLLELWPDAALPERRALAGALGKIGKTDSLALLGGFSTEDAELSRIVGKSKLMLSRTLGRGADSRIALERDLPGTTRLCIRCRAGVARLLADETSKLAPARIDSDDAVEISWAGAFGPLLSLRTALDFAIVAGLSGRPDVALETRIVETLAASELRQKLASWTDGGVRFRLAWAAGGHRRASVWRVAQAISERATELVNDPTRAPWEFIVDERRERLLLFPRRFDDPRFAYRKRDVRGSSHPTIAAALAREAGVRPGDVVWDPFAGAGLELIERAILGPYRELHASDTDGGALSAARENFAAAGIQVETITLADARAHRVPGLTLIVTNPPMGRRVARKAGLFDLLSAFMARAYSNLEPGGRLVWLSPMAERTARAAGALGFEVQRRESIDLGGFCAELQHCRK